MEEVGGLYWAPYACTVIPFYIMVTISYLFFQCCPCVDIVPNCHVENDMQVNLQSRVCRKNAKKFHKKL